MTNGKTCVKKILELKNEKFIIINLIKMNNLQFLKSYNLLQNL
jgi:hypothetical protein